MREFVQQRLFLLLLLKWPLTHTLTSTSKLILPTCESRSVEASTDGGDGVAVCAPCLQCHLIITSLAVAANPPSETAATAVNRCLRGG